MEHKGCSRTKDRTVAVVGKGERRGVWSVRRCGTDQPPVLPVLAGLTNPPQDKLNKLLKASSGLGFQVWRGLRFD